MASNKLNDKPVLRGVVFDLDGTVVTPSLDLDEMYKRVGVDRAEDILKAVEEMPQDQAERARKIIKEVEIQGQKNMRLIPGTVRLAEWLARHKVPMALVTRNSKEGIRVLHEDLWLPLGLPVFDPAISRDDEYPAKPDPRALFAIAENWQVECSSELLMIGDSLKYDVGFGKNAGVSTALLTGSPHSTEHEAKEDPTLAPDFSCQNLALLAHKLYSAFIVDSPVAGQLKKYSTPSPTTEACQLAASGNSKLLLSIIKDDSNYLKVLDAPDECGNTPLIWATEYGHLEVVSVLVEAGVGLDAQGFLGATAISRACRSGHCDILRLLLARGGDPNICNDKMQYPMHFAAFKKHPEAVSLLLEHKADTYVLDRKGRTPAEDTSDRAIRTQILDSR